jgi:hypothetical protein
MALRTVLALSATLALIALAAKWLQDAPTEAAAQKRIEAGGDVAARGNGGLVASLDEVERVLLNRYGASSIGQDLLDLLLKAQLLEALAEEEGIQIGPRDVAQRWTELDKQTRAAGLVGGILAEIESKGFTPEEFREFLRVAIIQERLARQALGIADDDAVTGDQQEVWLEQEMATRGFERPAPPWPEGFVARCGQVEVGVDDYADFLRRRLPRNQISETCWHVLLMKGLEGRMPDLAPAALDRAIDADIARRRAEHVLEYPQISYEQRLGATGRTIQSLREDPSVRIAALSRIWVDRNHGTDGLRKTYEDERAFFDGRFGTAVHTDMLFLVAGRFANELVKRTYENADEELERIVSRVGNTDDFAALAGQLSEEPNSKEKDGELGWITSADPRYPKPLCAAVFEVVNTGGKIPIEGRAVGPVHLDTGSTMLWVSGIRESPSWEVMSEHVHEELRRRFMEDVMPRNSVEVK